ncbi:hypothetical protein ACLOJK_005961 [Asimina triloba]
MCTNTRAPRSTKFRCSIFPKSMAAATGGGQGSAIFFGFCHQQHGGDRSGRSRRRSAGRQIGAASSSSSRSAKTHQIGVHSGAGSEAASGGSEVGQRLPHERTSRSGGRPGGRDGEAAADRGRAAAGQRRIAATQRQTDGYHPPRQQIGATHPRGEQARGGDDPPSSSQPSTIHLPTSQPPHINVSLTMRHQQGRKSPYKMGKAGIKGTSTFELGSFSPMGGERASASVVARRDWARKQKLEIEKVDNFEGEKQNLR